jgi:probable HAF family extracellular repeat protein
MNFDLDSSERARNRARNAVVLSTATVIVMTLFTMLPARAAGGQSYDITNLSLGGRVNHIAGINANGQVAGYGTLPQEGVAHSYIASRANGVVDIGTLGGTSSFATAVNASGQVIGYSDAANDTQWRAFSWTSSGGMVDLGTPPAKSAFPSAVNDSGQVVGTWATDGDGAQGFSWTSSGGLVSLGTLGGSRTVPFLVDPSGQVVGISRTTDDPYIYHAFSWTQTGGMVDIGALGGPRSMPVALNKFGQVVGYSTRADGNDHAFLWSRAGGLVDLGTLNGLESAAMAITDAGQVIGHAYATPGPEIHVFSWTQSGGMVDIGSLGGIVTAALGVNAKGEVVGYSQTSDNALHAFSWTSAGGMVDLGTLGGKSSVARYLNDTGQIVGHSDLPGDLMYHAFVSNGFGLQDLNNLAKGIPAGMQIYEITSFSASGSIVAQSNAGDVLLTPTSPAPAAPVVGPIVANDPIAVGATVSASASFTDVNTADSHSASWTWGDGSAAQMGIVTESGGSGSAKGSHAFAAAGVYSVALAVTDSSGLTSNVNSSVVVYDPTAGFVTGNGSIQSPAGAFKADATVAGPATFSFVSKYQKGAKAPVGTTSFQFQSAALDFYSDSYDWMVVTGQARAQFKGSGTLDGAAGYKFLLTAIDGQVTGGGGTDRFRIKIWHYDASAQQDIVDYDNQLDASSEGTPSEGTAIRSGNIVIHTPNK